MLRSVTTSEIPMTPDGTVVWKQHIIPDIGAVLLHAAECEPDIVELMVKASQAPRAYKQAKAVAGNRGLPGGYGKVYEESAGKRPIALKLHSYPLGSDTERHQGISGLRANVAVSAGLSRLALKQGTTFSAQPKRDVHMHPPKATFRLAAPRYLAALLNMRADSPAADVWAMSFETSSPSGIYRLPVPAYDGCSKVLDAACETVGLDPALIEYDSGSDLRNMLVRPGTAGVDTELVKIDNYAKCYLEF